jgi:hypothetical protein
MSRRFVLSCILVLIVNLSLAAEEKTASPTSLPPPYRDKFLVAEPVSPNKQFAVIYPRKYVCVGETENKDCQDYLVALRPFQIITKLETVSPEFEHKNLGGMSVAWSGDSTVALITLESHYGPGEIFVVELRDGKVVRSANLLNKIRERLEPDYLASNVGEPFNDYVHFVFEDEERSGEKHPTVELKGKTVQVHAYATNDPNMSRDTVWEGKFDGAWDVAQGKFTSGKVTREFAGLRKR